MRRAILSLVVFAFGVGCTGSPIPTPSPSTSPTIFPSPIPATPAPVERPTVALTADLSDAPAEWDEVTSIPIGDGPNEVGLKPAHETPPIGPNSFAIADDGSFWIIDAANQRVAHFSRAGHLLGEIPDSVGSGSTDLAFVQDTLWVISLHHKGIVFPILADGHRSAPNVVSEDGKTVYVQDFIPTPQGLFAEIGGYTDPPLKGPNGIYQVELPGSGYIEEAPGFVLKNGTAFLLHETGDQEYDIYYIKDDRQTVQPLRINVVSTEHYGKRKLNGPVGLGDFVVDGNDVYMFCQTSVSKPDGSGDQLGGRFLVRVGSSPMIFERLPDATNEDDTQVRHIALGPDGHIYLMYIGRDGVSIYRRP